MRVRLVAASGAAVAAEVLVAASQQAALPQTPTQHPAAVAIRTSASRGAGRLARLHFPMKI